MSKAFTLLETLMIIAIIVFLAVLIFPLGSDFYKDQQLQSATQGILQTLRRAQLKAMAVEQDSSFGVHFDNTSKIYILFKGSSYIPSDPYNEKFDLPSTITMSSPLDIIFSKVEGKPIVNQAITLSISNQSQVININEIGRINLEL
jgi:type II secretory pathway pseudopilin PulG